MANDVATATVVRQQSDDSSDSIRVACVDAVANDGMPAACTEVNGADNDGTSEIPPIGMDDNGNAIGVW